ncbi:hypothetical protein PQX77_002784 [Marasmius sp. AFHP31]|nr:hypothetical protein PQX77_002784 [Marasmius sp. AFHP31]
MSTSATPVASTETPSATGALSQPPKQARKQKQKERQNAEEEKEHEVDNEAVVSPARSLDDDHYTVLHEHYAEEWKNFVLANDPNIDLKRNNKKLTEYKKKKADEVLHAIQNSIAPFDVCEKVTDTVTALNQIKRWFTNQRNKKMRAERGGGMTAGEAEKAIDKLIKFSSVQSGRQLFESEKKSDILDEAKT